MPQWAGSCWYYLRYLDAKNPHAFCSKEAERYWMSGAAIANRQSPIANPSGITDSQSSIANPQSAIRNPQSPTPGVDLYVGGTEHAVLHLLYARFWHKVLYDLGHVSTPEPFFKLVNQGLILGEDGQKMAKSRGNVVNPDEIVKNTGLMRFGSMRCSWPARDGETVEHPGRVGRVQVPRPRLAAVRGRTEREGV